MLLPGCSDGAVSLPEERKVSVSSAAAADPASLHGLVCMPLPLPLRSKSQRRRFEEELNERMIRTIDGINSQK